MSLDSVQVSSGPRPAAPPRDSRWPARRIGAMSLALALVSVGLEWLAIAVGSGGAWGPATALACFVIGFFVVAIALGMVAILARLGRVSGLSAIILSLIANPLTLVGIFHLLGSHG